MDEQKVRQAIAELDREVPRDGARVKLTEYGGGSDESRIVANRAGYLRLGIEFLKGAYPPSEDASNPVARDIDLKYLVTEDSTINFDWFELRESIEQDAEPSSATFIGLLCFAGLLAFLVLAVIGTSAVVGWFAT